MALKYFLVGFCVCLLLNHSFAEMTTKEENHEEPPPTTSSPPTNEKIIPTTLSTTPANTPSTTPATTTSTTPATTPSTTSATTPSTTPATTPSTTSATTSSTTPATTSSTTPATTSSTTPATTSSTSTTAPSTTAVPPAPTPLPDPEEGSWILEDKTENITCAVIHMALRMKIPYNTGVNKTEWALLNLPKNANITGDCDSMMLEKNITNVRLSWDNNSSYLDMMFIHDIEKKSYNVSDLLYSQVISENSFPNITVNGSLMFAGNTSGLLYVEAVPLGSSYKCSHKVTLNLTSTQDHTSKDFAMLTFSKIQIQAFMNSTSTGFGTVVECPGLDASDIVPIAVGCALAGLVIGVLIAFLVGRRRSHARGYLSM